MQVLKRKHIFVWFLIEFTNGEQKWYCASRVLRHALLCEKRINQFWKNTMIGNYITVATSNYQNNLAKLTVGKVIKIRLRHYGSNSYTWTRNQFVTAEHLRKFKDAYNYLKHDYQWYNRLEIYRSLRYWSLELKQKDFHRLKRRIRQKRFYFKAIRRKARRWLNKKGY